MANISRQALIETMRHCKNPQVLLTPDEAPAEILAQVPAAWWELCHLEHVDDVALVFVTRGRQCDVCTPH